MLKSRDQLQAGQWYNLPRLTAIWLVEQGLALGPVPNSNNLLRPEIKPAGPSEIKPAGPSEIKVIAKKKLKRTPTEKGF